MATLLQANREWTSRPADQRFVSLEEMGAYLRDIAARSRAVVCASNALTVQPDDDNIGLKVYGPNGTGYAPTHWGFGQVATLADSPAGFLRRLPSPMAADVLNYQLRCRAETQQDIQVLLQKDTDGNGILRAATGPTYGRIWNADVVSALVNTVGDGVTGTWRVPGEFGKAIEVTKQNTTLFASQQDMFIFLADEANRIEIPNRRDGQSGSLARGFFLWNSETGAKTLGIGTFLFDYACSNRIVWGAQDFKQITLRHSSGAPSRWLNEIKPALLAYSQSSESRVLETVKAAQAKQVDNVDMFLASRFGKRMVEPLKAVHMTEEYRPIESLWDVSTAVTAYARGIEHQDSRVDMERQGGDILALATA